MQFKEDTWYHARVTVNGSHASLMLNEEHKEPVNLIEFTDSSLPRVKGSIGMGTNKQKAVFSDISTKPIRIKRKVAVDVEMTVEMGKQEGVDPAAVELSPEAVTNNTAVPNVALGLNGGMAAKTDDMSQEEKINIEECLK